MLKISYIAEQSVIGSLLIDKDCMSDIYGILEPEMFTNELLGKIYHEYQRAYDRNEELTLATIEQKLRSDTFPSNIIMQEITECLNKTDTSALVKENANVVKNDYKAQKLNLILSTIKVSPNNIQEQIRALQNELEALYEDREDKSKTLAQITTENKDNYFKERNVTPVNLGFDKLDNLLGGLEGGDMIVIGARPGVGKSAFVTQIASNLAKQGKRVGFYNLEMKEKQVYERFVVSESGIGLTRLRRAVRFLGDEQEKFNKANEVLSKAENIVITSTGSKKPSEIKAESKHMDYDVIIVDYLQLLEPDKNYGGNRSAEVGNISRGIKKLAMDLNIPVIALSQINRMSESKETKEPTMAELREAGDIEQDASVIIMIWNLNEDDRSKKGCKVEKQRQGECGKVVMNFNGNLMRFEETEESIKEAREWKGNNNNDNPFE